MDEASKMQTNLLSAIVEAAIGTLVPSDENQAEISASQSDVVYTTAEYQHFGEYQHLPHFDSTHFQLMINKDDTFDEGDNRENRENRDEYDGDVSEENDQDSHRQQYDSQSQEVEKRKEKPRLPRPKRNVKAGIYRCDKCGHGWSTENGLKLHQLNAKNCTDHPCPVCEQSFTTFQEKCQHVELHWTTDQTKFQCFYCDQLFQNIADRNAHMRIVHKNQKGKFNCPLCDTKDLSSVSSLRNHRLTHSVFPVPRCDQCGLRFPNERLLANHFSSKHRNPHSTDYQCDICGRKLKVAYGLKLHMQVKHDLNPKLEWIKPRPNSFKMLLKMPPSSLHHTEAWKKLYKAAKFRCGTCQMAFSTQPMREKHFVSVHGRAFKLNDTDVYPCLFCDNVYRERSGSEVLKVHLLEDHPKEMDAWLEKSPSSGRK